MPLLPTFVFFSLALAATSASTTQSGPKGLESQPAPDFALTTLSGEQVKLSSLRGKVVLINFWVSWSAPCKVELPYFQQFSGDKELIGNGLIVLAINQREPREKVRDFLARNNLTLAVPLDSDGAVSNSFQVPGFPTTVLIGRDGIIRKIIFGYGGDDGAKELRAMIEDALKSPATPATMTTATPATMTTATPTTQS